MDGIFLCGFAMGLWTKHLLQKAVTNILNLTSMEYTKRTKYFKYLNIDVHNTSDEDIKKHFRISNRFIREVWPLDMHLDIGKERQDPNPLQRRPQHRALFSIGLHDQRAQVALEKWSRKAATSDSKPRYC